MKKLRFEMSPNAGEVLTRNELKYVFGGDGGTGSGAGSGSGSGSEDCGCSSKRSGDSCCYYSNGVKHNGSCRHMPIAGLVCWGG